MANTKDLLKKSSGVKGWCCMPLIPAGRSPRSKPTCSTEQVPGQAMLHGETLSGGERVEGRSPIETDYIKLS